MRKATAGVGAIIVSLAMTVAPAVAQQKPQTPSGSHTVGAQSAPSAGFAKAPGHGTTAPKHESKHGTAASKHATARAKGGHAKKGHSTVQVHVRTKPADASGPAAALQLHGGGAGSFMGWPFTRPGSPGRFGGDHVKRQYGGFVGWFGPVFWPYAYDDMFDYVLWPFDSFDDGDAFWAFAYDDLFEGIFWAEAEPAGERTEVVAAAEGDANSADRSRAGVLGLEGQSREFAQICGDRSPGLSQWPILRIAQNVGLTREQRITLKDLQNAAAAAARVLKSACPLETPTTSIERLDAMQERVLAMLRAVELVRPALERFYEPLNDAQKARFQATASQTFRDDEAAASAGGENELVPQICTDHPAGLSVQTIDRLENLIRPTDSQRGAFDELRTAAARAAQVLRAACPVGTPGNPPERLAAMRHRLGAMLDAASLVSPALQSLYGSLSDAQKTRFNALGRQADRSGG